jgi:hypothetical protein
MEYKDLFNENQTYSWENKEEKIFFNKFFSVITSLENFYEKTDFIAYHISLQDNKRLFIEKVKAKFLHLQDKGKIGTDDKLGSYLIHMINVYPVQKIERPLVYSLIEIEIPKSIEKSNAFKHPYMTPKQVADLLTCSVRHVRDLYWKDQHLNFKKVNRRILIETESVSKFIENQNKVKSQKI